MDIKSLKDKILQLAIRGKLVPQNQNDEPAIILLEKIKAQKEQLIKDKVIKKEKLLSEISDEEKLFELPKGWEWCRLGNIIALVSGRDLNNNVCNSEGIGIPYIMGASNMLKDGLSIERWVESPTVIGLKNDIIISVKGTVGKLDIINLEKVHLSRQVMSIRCYSELIYNKYILLYLKSYIERIKEKSSGVIPGISRDNLLQIITPIPPLEEQQRIVAKVDELFELIDELDSNKQDLLENIGDLRNKILQLAIQGKLVEQCEDDEPVSVLLETIKQEKEQLIKDKVIKKEKTLPEISEEEKQFELPKGWQWCRFSQVLDVRDGTHDTPKYVEKGIPLITSKNINRNQIDFENVKYISLEDHKEISKRSKVDDGDILFAMIGSIGNPVIVNKKIDFSIKNVALFKYYKNNCVNNKFLYYYLLFSQDNMKKNAKGAVQTFVSLKMLREYLLPLPPLEEQKRIVAKVDLIMDYLDKLQQEIESQEIILEDILK